MNIIDCYIDEVLSNIVADDKMKNRIKSDLTMQLNEAGQSEDIEEVLRKMGNPKDVAREFMDSIYENKSEIIENLIREHTKVANLLNDYYEYESKTTLLGLPLVHIKINRHGGRLCVAKGIIAIGTVSIGVISIGAVPFGFLCFGGAAVGIISFGGLAIGLLTAIGGVALGALAVGGMAIGLGAIGGFAIGEIAIGGYARGTAAAGTRAVGEYTLITRHLGPETKDAVYTLIKTAFPRLPDWIANMFSSIETYLGNSR